MSQDYTYLLFAPEADSGVSPERIEGLAQAIIKAGGKAVIIPNQFSYDYAQDLFILIRCYAFYPSVLGEMDYKRKAFKPYIEAAGYHCYDIKQLPSLEYDGGNFRVDEQRQLILTGLNNTLADADHDAASALRITSRDMARDTGYDDLLIRNTCPHLDCCIGLMPNGKLLVKLDELQFDEINSPLAIYTRGVTDYGIGLLEEFYGRGAICTFSFAQHPQADFVLGMDALNNPNVAKSLSMLTNFISVNQTIIGEDFPLTLRNHFEEEGIQFISPNDVGLTSFLPPTVGFVGGAHCSSLAVRFLRPQALQSILSQKIASLENKS